MNDNANEAGKPAAPLNLSMSAELSGEARSAPRLSPEQEGRLRSQATATAFGEVVGALMRSERHRRLRLDDIDARYVPAMQLGQFAVAHAGVPGRAGESVPIAVIFWAFVSEEADKRLSREAAFPVSIARNEWRSGSIPWIVDAAGPPQAVRELLADLSSRALNGTVPKHPAGAV